MKCDISIQGWITLHLSLPTRTFYLPIMGTRAKSIPFPTRIQYISTQQNNNRSNLRNANSVQMGKQTGTAARGIQWGNTHGVKCAVYV